jgi:hypothetical protein
MVYEKRLHLQHVTINGKCIFEIKFWLTRKYLAKKLTKKSKANEKDSKLVDEFV